MEMYDGDISQYWEDSWNGHPPLNQVEFLTRYIFIFKDFWRSKFFECVLTIELFLRKFIWKEPYKISIIGCN